MKQLLKHAKKISMFIFAIAFLGCTDADSIFPTVTSNFTYTINEDTGTVTFINISEDARTYAWNFGDGTSSTEINPIKTYAESGTYTVTLTAKNDAGGSDSAQSEVIVTITAVPPPGGGGDPEVATSLPIDFESNETLSGVFEEGDGVTGAPIANPDQSGINTSDTVYEFNKATGAAWYSGIFQIFPSDIDLSTTQSFTFKIWSPKAGINVRLQLEKEGGGPVTYQIDQTLATADEWVSLTYDFTGIVDPADGYDKIVIFPDFDATNETPGDGSIYYLDDIEQGDGSAGGGCTDTALELPIDFDCSTITYDFVTFNGASYSVVDNPDLSGVNDVASKVGEIVNVGAAFEGGAFTLDTPVDFTTDKAITMKFYSTVGVPVLLKFEGAGAPVETTATHGGTGWEQLTFEFTTSDQFGTLVLFVDGPGATAGTFYMDDIEQVAAGGGCTDTALELPIDFDCSTITYDFVTFNGASYSVVDNPDLSGVNDVASKVGEIVNVGAAFEGGAFTLDTPVDFTTDKAITMKFYSTVGVPVLLKFEGAGAPVETTATHGGTGWEQLTFEFTTSDQFGTLVLFVDGPGATAGTFYMDDIEQVPATGGGCTDTALELPIDFDCSTITYDFVTFNGASYSVVDNPDLSGVNNVASKVGEIVNIGGAFEGGAFTLDTPVDFTTDKAITMKFYSTVGVPVLLKFEGAGAPVETTATHGGTGWEQLTFEFTTSDQFGTLVLFVDGPGATAGTFYMDDIEQVPATGGGCTDTALELPIDFDCSTITYDFVTFNGASYSVVDNPDLSGVNNVASKVGEIVNIGGAFEGGAFTLDTPVDFTTDKAITMKFYSTVGVPVLLKFEGAGAPVETTATHGGTGWEQLTFEFTTSDQFGTLVLFVDGPGATAGTFYMDDIEQVPATGGGCTDTALELPIDFDCSTITYDFVTFNGASYSVVDNPDLSGVNNVASKVGEIVNIGGAFEGGAFTLDTPVDFTTDKAITMKFYSTVGVPVLLKFEGAGAPVETTATHGGTGWEQLTFTFTTSDQFGTLVLFVDGPGATAGTFYMDDIEQVAAGGGGTGGELAANGDFETGDDTGWLLFQNGGSSALDNTINNGGTWSGRLATGGPSNPAFKQERIGAGSVNAGDTVQVQFDHIGSVVQPGAVFNVILFGEGAAGASFTNIFNPAPTLTGSWTTFTGTFTIPGGTDVSEGISFLIEAVCGGDAGCSVIANIDNVSVTVL